MTAAQWVTPALTVLATIIGSGGAVTYALERMKRDDRREGREKRATETNAREVTARRVIADGAAARGEALLERTLGSKTVECAECQEQLAAERNAHTATQVHLATCEQDRVHTRAINRWLAARVDKLDGGGSIPPFPLDDHPAHAPTSPEPA